MPRKSPLGFLLNNDDITDDEYFTKKPVVFRINENGAGPELLLQVFLERGWIEYDDEIHSPDGWHIWWRTSRFRTGEYSSLLPWQCINHFPGCTVITKKDALCRNIRKMKIIHGFHVYNFSPKAFNLPNDYTKFVSDYAAIRAKAKPNSAPTMWICKPAESSRGRGIFIFSELAELQYDCNAVVQQYIANPLLIGGYKFDIRIYVAVPSFNPLQIYIHEEGLTRFSTEKYDLDRLDNVFAHLTNTSINKFSPGYTADKDEVGHGCKWTITQLRRYFQQNAIDDTKIWQQITNIVILTVLMQAPSAPKMDNCFELYGFDILIDSSLKAWLLEVNFSPALSSDCQADIVTKKSMLHDLMSLIEMSSMDNEPYYTTSVNGYAMSNRDYADTARTSTSTTSKTSHLSNGSNASLVSSFRSSNGHGQTFKLPPNPHTSNAHRVRRGRHKKYNFGLNNSQTNSPSISFNLPKTQKHDTNITSSSEKLKSYYSDKLNSRSSSQPNPGKIASTVMRSYSLPCSNNLTTTEYSGGLKIRSPTNNSGSSKRHTPSVLEHLNHSLSIEGLDKGLYDDFENNAISAQLSKRFNRSSSDNSEKNKKCISETLAEIGVFYDVKKDAGEEGNESEPVTNKTRETFKNEVRLHLNLNLPGFISDDNDVKGFNCDDKKKYEIKVVRGNMKGNGLKHIISPIPPINNNNSSIITAGIGNGKEKHHNKITSFPTPRRHDKQAHLPEESGLKTEINLNCVKSQSHTSVSAAWPENNSSPRSSGSTSPNSGQRFSIPRNFSRLEIARFPYSYHHARHGNGTNIPGKNGAAPLSRIPPKQVGRFFLVFPFNEATQKLSSAGTLETKSVIKEILRQNVKNKKAEDGQGSPSRAGQNYIWPPLSKNCS